MRIALCIPHASERVYGPWFYELTDRINEVDRDTHTIRPFYMFMQPVERSRNYLVHQAYRWKADAVLFLDDDIWLPENGINIMIEQMGDKNILNLLCPFRCQKLVWVVTPRSLAKKHETVEA